MDEYIIYEGTIENICNELAEDFRAAGEIPLSIEECKHLIRFIQENKELLGEDELIQCIAPNKDVIGVSEFITEQMSYYIGLKQSSIYLMLFLLGFHTKGVSSFIAMLSGITTSGKVVIPIDAEAGIKCIVMELARNRKHGAGVNLLKKYKGQCCNNQYSCRYRENESCNLHSDKIEKILEYLETNKVIKKKLNRYYYQL